MQLIVVISCADTELADGRDDGVLDDRRTDAQVDEEVEDPDEDEHREHDDHDHHHEDDQRHHQDHHSEDASRPGTARDLITRGRGCDRLPNAPLCRRRSRHCLSSPRS